MPARSSWNACAVGRPSLLADWAFSLSQPSLSILLGSSSEPASGTGTRRLRRRNPTAFSTEPFPFPGQGAAAALAAAMGPELGEEPRLCDLAEGHPPRLGGAAGDEHARRAPRPPEDAAQPPAEDLGPLAWQRHAEARVRVREARHQELQGHAHAAYRRHEVAEVDLGRAWGPQELEEAILRPLDVLPLPAGHVPAYRGVGSGIPLLGDRPVVDPLGRMALLPWHGEVGLEYRVDPPRYPVGRWMRPLLPGRRLRRHVLHVRVLPDGVPAEMELARYVGPRRPIPVHPPDILLLIQGHGHYSTDLLNS